MKKIFVIFIMCLGLINKTVSTGLADINALKPWDEAEKKLHELFPEFQILENKYPNNMEIQLGLEVLYARFAVSEYPATKVEEQWKRVLRIDPNNRPAWAISVTKAIQFNTARRRAIIKQLEGKIENAKKRGSQQLTIPRKISYAQTSIKKDDSITKVPPQEYESDLFPYLSKGNEEVVVINDFDAAIGQLKEQLDKELGGMFGIVNQAEKIDHDNALYNYLKAHLYFTLDKSESGLGEIRKATQKKYLNTYFTETRHAISIVLQTVNFPDNLRCHIEDVYSPFGDFIRREICKNGLEPLSRRYEEQGDNENVIEISELMLKIAKQISEEPLPYSSFINPGISQGLEKRAQELKKEISQKIKNKEEK
jgi:hypothetical protein